MSVITLALILLTLRFIAVAFMLRVLSIQFPLLTAQNHPEVKPLRYLLFIFAVIITVGNVVPITVDLHALLSPDTSNGNISTLTLAYLLNNAFVAGLSAACFWLIYKVTGLNNGDS